MNEIKCPACGSGNYGFSVYSGFYCQQLRCNTVWDYGSKGAVVRTQEELESETKRLLERVRHLFAGPEKGYLSNDVYVSQGNYGSTIASIGVPTLGSTPIGKLSGIPCDDIVRDHHGSSVGKVRSVGNCKILAREWWRP